MQISTRLKRIPFSNPSALVRCAPARLRPTVQAIRTCFRFDGDDDFGGDDDDDEMNTHKWLSRRQHPPIVQLLNRMYEASPPSPSEDLMAWMHDYWGGLLVIELVLVHRELNLRVFNAPAVGKEAEDLYETISKQLTDCMRLEYVKHHLSARLSLLRHTPSLPYIDISLGLYF